MRKLILVSLAVLLLLSPFVPAQTAEAASFTVNDFSDDVDRNPGNGQCRVNLIGAARCTLRAAIMEANALPGADTILLPAGVYVLTRTGPLDATAENGDLDIRDHVTLSGAGAGVTIIDGNGSLIQDRVLDLLHTHGEPAVSVTISGVTIRGGRSAQHGGGIGVAGGVHLTLQNSVVTQNFALAGGGGLVASEESMVTIIGSALSANTTDGDGGGFSGRSEYGPGTRWNFVNSTISGNSAAGSGGGLFFANVNGLECCVGTDAVLPQLFSTTVTHNAADSDRAGGGNGGGLAGVGAVLHNTLLAGNFDRTRVALGAIIHPDCSTTVANGSRFSLIQNTAGCTLAPNFPGLITSQDPLLGPLANNGGPTPTHLIGAGPALNAGDTTSCRDQFGNPLITDQRGFNRHVEPGGGFGRCDIGAVEVAGGQ